MNTSSNKLLYNYEHDTFVYKNIILSALSYLPTPPLGQDMTQGQFLSRV